MNSKSRMFASFYLYPFVTIFNFIKRIIFINDKNILSQNEDINNINDINFNDLNIAKIDPKNNYLNCI